MNIDGKEYSEGQLRMLLRAVKRVLKADEHDICDANQGLLDTAIHIRLVTEDELQEADEWIIV
ncbi:hypothetical protein LCGC14_1330480 [marine sediment metagenome]|uniref:Uncharacterized protein n=1 Tax=marine sediment metagenome TaxID=412755 RepID=A0A0F9NJ81_9ZZZZ